MKAELRITACFRNGRTILKESFATPPFKVADITEDRNAGLLRLMVMNASPGILDGDDYKLTISVREDSMLELTTQSYQRLFTMKQGAVQHLTLLLEKNASFLYLPHPCVPHHQSAFTSKNSLHLAAGSTLLWGEILTCGRKMNGEVFSFTSYQNLTEIFLEGRLVVRENLVVQPARLHPLQLGQLEGFTHQASLIFLKATCDYQEVMKIISELLSGKEGILFGITRLTQPGFMLRILGHKAEQLFDLLKQIAQLVPWYDEINKEVDSLHVT